MYLVTTAVTVAEMESVVGSQKAPTDSRIQGTLSLMTRGLSRAFGKASAMRKLKAFGD